METQILWHLRFRACLFGILFFSSVLDLPTRLEVLLNPSGVNVQPGDQKFCLDLSPALQVQLCSSMLSRRTYIAVVNSGVLFDPPCNSFVCSCIGSSI